MISSFPDFRKRRADISITCARSQKTKTEAALEPEPQEDVVVLPLGWSLGVLCFAEETLIRGSQNEEMAEHLLV